MNDKDIIFRILDRKRGSESVLSVLKSKSRGLVSAGVDEFSKTLELDGFTATARGYETAKNEVTVKVRILPGVPVWHSIRDKEKENEDDETVKEFWIVNSYDEPVRKLLSLTMKKEKIRYPSSTAADNQPIYFEETIESYVTSDDARTIVVVMRVLVYVPDIYGPHPEGAHNFRVFRDGVEASSFRTYIWKGVDYTDEIEKSTYYFYKYGPVPLYGGILGLSINKDGTRVLGKFALIGTAYTNSVGFGIFNILLGGDGVPPVVDSFISGTNNYAQFDGQLPTGFGFQTLDPNFNKILYTDSEARYFVMVMEGYYFEDPKKGFVALVKVELPSFKGSLIGSHEVTFDRHAESVAIGNLGVPQSFDRYQATWHFAIAPTGKAWAISYVTNIKGNVTITEVWSEDGKELLEHKYLYKFLSPATQHTYVHCDGKIVDDIGEIGGIPLADHYEYTKSSSGLVEEKKLFYGSNFPAFALRSGCISEDGTRFTTSIAGVSFEFGFKSDEINTDDFRHLQHRHYFPDLFLLPSTRDEEGREGMVMMSGDGRAIIGFGRKGTDGTLSPKYAYIDLNKVDEKKLPAAMVDFQSLPSYQANYRFFHSGISRPHSVVQCIRIVVGDKDVINLVEFKAVTYPSSRWGTRFVLSQKDMKTDPVSGTLMNAGFNPI